MKVFHPSLKFLTLFSSSHFFQFHKLWDCVVKGQSLYAFLFKVYVGDTRCEVDDLTDVQIVCTIADTGTKHYVSNEGTSDGKYM